MAINAFVGVVFGAAALAQSPGWGVYGMFFGIAWAGLAVGCAKRSPEARVAALVLAAIVLVISLAQMRIEIGTNLVILIALLMPSASGAMGRRQEPFAAGGQQAPETKP